MKISDIKPNQGRINVEGIITEKDKVREMNSNGNNLKVANAVLEDDSGSIKLTLWNEETNKVTVSDKIRITNGFAKSYRDELQLSAGKFGKLEIMGHGNLKDTKSQIEGKVEVMDDEYYYEDEEEW